MHIPHSYGQMEMWLNNETGDTFRSRERLYLHQFCLTTPGGGTHSPTDLAASSHPHTPYDTAACSASVPKERQL